MLCIRCKDKPARRKYCEQCAIVVKKEQRGKWQKNRKEKNQVYMPPSIVQRLDALKERVEKPYAQTGKKSNISVGDVVSWLIGKLDYADYYGKNAEEMNNMREKMNILHDETRKKSIRDRKLIKNYTDANGFELDYSKVPGLDQFVEDKDLEVIRKLKK